MGRPANLVGWNLRVLLAPSLCKASTSGFASANYSNAAVSAHVHVRFSSRPLQAAENTETRPGATEGAMETKEKCVSQGASSRRDTAGSKLDVPSTPRLRDSVHRTI